MKNKAKEMLSLGKSFFFIYILSFAYKLSKDQVIGDIPRWLALDIFMCDR